MKESTILEVAEIPTSFSGHRITIQRLEILNFHSKGGTLRSKLGSNGSWFCDGCIDSVNLVKMFDASPGTACVDGSPGSGCEDGRRREKMGGEGSLLHLWILLPLYSLPLLLILLLIPLFFYWFLSSSADPSLLLPIPLFSHWFLSSSSSGAFL